MDENFNNDYQENVQENSPSESYYYEKSVQATSPQNNIEHYVDEPEPSKGLAIASLVCGIVSIVFCCTSWIGGLVGIAGLITGILAKSKRQGGSGMSTAGIICSVIGILLSIIMLVFIGLAALGEVLAY